MGFLYHTLSPQVQGTSCQRGQKDQKPYVRMDFGETVSSGRDGTFALITSIEAQQLWLPAQKLRRASQPAFQSGRGGAQSPTPAEGLLIVKGCCGSENQGFFFFREIDPGRLTTVQWTDPQLCVHGQY